MARTLIASDDFNRANGAVGSNWAYIRNTAWTANPPEVSSNTLIARANGDNYQVCRWVGAGSFKDNQYAKLTIGGMGFFGLAYRQGVVVRCSADTDTGADYYGYYIQDDGASDKTTTLFKVVNGTQTSINSASVAWSNGDTIELEADGTTLYGYKNGSLILTSTSQSDLATGKPGFAIGGDDPTPPNAGAWEGGDVSAAATGGTRRTLLGVG